MECFILLNSFDSLFQLKVKIVVKEWQFSDGSHSMTNISASSQKSLKGSSNLLSKTGRKLKITVVEAKDLAASDRFGNFDPYVKLQYGKVRGTGCLFDFLSLTALTYIDELRSLIYLY